MGRHARTEPRAGGTHPVRARRGPGDSDGAAALRLVALGSARTSIEASSGSDRAELPGADPFHEDQSGAALSGGVPRRTGSAGASGRALRLPGGASAARWVSASRWVMLVVALAAAAIGLGWAAADSTFGAGPGPAPVVLASDLPMTPDEAERPAAEPPDAEPSDPEPPDAEPSHVDADALETASRTTPATIPRPGGTTSEPPSPRAPGEAPPEAMPAPGTLPGTSWRAVLEVLDQRRSSAFARGDEVLLTRVYAAGSAPLERDSAALAELAGRGLRAAGLNQRLDEVTLVAIDAERATVRVVDQLDPYQLVDATGRTVEAVPGRGPVAWVLTIAPGADGWLVSQVVRDAAPPLPTG